MNTTKNQTQDQTEWVKPQQKKIVKHSYLPWLAVLMIPLFLNILTFKLTISDISFFVHIHTTLEMFSVIVSIMLFTIGWAARSRINSGNLIVLACAFLSVGLLDFLHALSYIGMPDFITHNDHNKQLFFGLSAKVIGVFALLFVAVNLNRSAFNQKTIYSLLIGSVFFATITLIYVIVFPNNLPILFVENQGFTPFKKIISYLVILGYITAALILYKKINNKNNFLNINLIFISVILLALGELFFNIETNMEGVFNIIGHIYKIIAYVLLYKAILIFSIDIPFKQMMELKNNLNLAIKSANLGIWDWDLKTDHVYYSSLWKNQLGFKNNELKNVLGTFEARIHPEDKYHTTKNSSDFAQHPTQMVLEQEFRMIKKNGDIVWIMSRSEKHKTQDGSYSRIIGAHLDITESKKNEEHINHLANYDSLTGLANRNLLRTTFNKLNISKTPEYYLSLIFIDLDNFKHINDTLGHNMGDLLLKEVANRLKAITGTDHFAGRLGGDEFVIIVKVSKDAMFVEESFTNFLNEYATMLLNILSQPYLLEEHELFITPSIGLSFKSSDEDNFDTLTQQSDIAMYFSKNNGKNSFSHYNQEMKDIIHRHIHIKNGLISAIQNDELYIEYQPQFNTKNGTKITGVEALLRWKSPEFGVISPAEFIPIAEKNGLIVDLGNWVLTKSISQLSQWIKDGIDPISMSINISAIQFNQPNLIQHILKIINTNNISPNLITLELTEGIAMQDPKQTLHIINTLNKHGIQWSIDDFGTGYSSLSYLTKFKINTLKIDKSFVMEIKKNKQNEYIIQTIIQMAHNFGFNILAEGVETEEQLKFLKDNGCFNIQGFLLGKPVSAEKTKQILLNNKI